MFANFGLAGSFGQKFLYEMDVVFGALFNMKKHYSKIEALILTPGVVALWNFNALNDKSSFYVSIGHARHRPKFEDFFPPKLTCVSTENDFFQPETALLIGNDGF